MKKLSVIAVLVALAIPTTAQAQTEACDSLDASTLATTKIEADALAAVTSVTVFPVDACTSAELAAMTGAGLSAIGGNQIVIDALATSGRSTGVDIIAYQLEEAALTIYVRDIM